MKKNNVFVTDGISPATPAIIESLAKHGYRIHCGEEFYWNASFFSKYCHKRVVYPSPEKSPATFINFLLDYLSKNTIDYLIPVRCWVIEQILQNKEILSKHTKFLLPEYTDWLKAEYKHQTLKIAQQNDIPIPRTVFSQNAFYNSLNSQLGLPFIIKVSRSSGARGIKLIYDEDTFRSLKEYYIKNNIDFVYQEWIPEGGKSVNASYLFDQNGDLVARFLMEKIRQYPLKGGSTSFAKAIYNDNLLDLGANLLKKLNWKGVAEIEYVQDPRDGHYKLMEINPRFWNPLLLSIKSGIDYPLLITEILNQKKIDQHFCYRTDLSFSFLPYEMINYFKTLKINILRSLIPTGKNYDVFFRFNDLSLFLGFMIQIFYILYNKRKQYIYPRVSS